VKGRAWIILGASLALSGCALMSGTPFTVAGQATATSVVLPASIPAPTRTPIPIPDMSPENARILLSHVVQLNALAASIGKITQADSLDCGSVERLNSLPAEELPFRPDLVDLSVLETEYRDARSGVAQSIKHLTVGCAQNNLMADWYGQAAGALPRLWELMNGAVAHLGVPAEPASVGRQGAADLYSRPEGMPFEQLPPGSRVEFFYSESTANGRWCLVRPSDRGNLLGWVRCGHLEQIPAQ
jgi:hypothetical protein